MYTCTFNRNNGVNNLPECRVYNKASNNPIHGHKDVFHWLHSQTNDSAGKWMPAFLLIRSGKQVCCEIKQQ